MAVDFKSKQAEFAAYIRDPLKNVPPADVHPQRMVMYHELFFNNFDSFLSSNFPVIRTLFDDSQWQALSSDFFATHRCKTPYFAEFAEEFISYLQNRPPVEGYPFLLELAHYEWVEMALSIAEAEPRLADSTFIENLSTQALALSPLAWPLAYQYPVQQISTQYLPLTPPDFPTYLLVYRDQDYNVHFVQITPLTYRLLDILEQQPGSSAMQCINSLSAEIQQFDADTLSREGLKIFQDMLLKGIVIPADGV
ncbi:putative DNA-binding domain-containing protein [Methylomonas sp. AM2-LC]|uniref:HvfC family RiPP maturation protein n=1 Tax=Methylomonas sp. AM2-LC TaxID=3153301 RepID=UPI003264DE8D